MTSNVVAASPRYEICAILPRRISGICISVMSQSSSSSSFVLGRFPVVRAKLSLLASFPYPLSIREPPRTPNRPKGRSGSVHPFATTSDPQPTTRTTTRTILRMRKARQQVSAYGLRTLIYSSAIRFFISSGDTSSTWVATFQTWPKGSVNMPERSP